MRAVFLNDIGFQMGAGMAHLRQVQSFLLMGHEVAAVCWSYSAEEVSAAFGPGGPPPGFLGIRMLYELRAERGHDPDSMTAALVEEVGRFQPDLVVVGNLHGAGWPLSVLGALRDAGHRTVAYMHDCYLISGRCAYPGECRLFESGCDETCPTADEYPALPPAQIPAAWRMRRDLLCGSLGVPLAVNSAWTLDMARQALPGLRHAGVVYYGLDSHLFRPVDRSLARRLLGIPQEAFVVLAGAVNLSERRKGGHILREVIGALDGRAHFLLFGKPTPDLASAQTLGYVRDFRRMPLIYSAADVFLGTSLEEAFGQTFCEAAACGIPVVAFGAGGVPEAVRDRENARLATEMCSEALLVELTDLMNAPDLRLEMGRAGRALVEREFTLARQGERWRAFLDGLPAA